VETKFIEATNGEQNWGKFMIGRFTPEEWANRSAIDPRFSLIAGRGWSRDHIMVFDLQTGEGAIFKPGGHAPNDLRKHAIWVCPMFEPFLEWLYQQDLTDLTALPAHVDIPEAAFSFSGYRREGPGPNALTEPQKQALVAVLSLAENSSIWYAPRSQSDKAFFDEQYAHITTIRELLKANGVVTLHEMAQRMAGKQS
jgi:hypothetical protein